MIRFEQTENYAHERGPEGNRDDWHNRSTGISEATSKAVSKWMPEELVALAEQKSEERVLGLWPSVLLERTSK